MNKNDYIKITVFQLLDNKKKKMASVGRIQQNQFKKKS